MIRIPFLENLEAATMGHALPKRIGRFAHYDKELQPRDAMAKNDTMVRHRVELNFDQVIPARPTGGLPIAHEIDRQKRAVRAFSHMLYGPIEAELMEIMHRLWEDGEPPTSPVMKRIEDLLKAVRGETWP